ncbi:MAG TPA: class I SAM-dependent methyltransferase [Rhizomicrobium sp.]|nr:class I SAM-dependent methyltransferase [Rhizomicrobium sp.]
MNSLEEDGALKTLLARLHAASDAQTPALARFIRDHGYRSVSGSEADLEKGRDFWRDKLVAFEPDKARFCYMLCRALGARCVVEVGTSFGVSTLYLAAALRDNGGGQVIATEIEPEKAAIARAHFEAAGLSAYVDLREGDVRQTLRGLAGPVDFVLMDIWTPLARPAIEHIGPQMRGGGIVIADNTNTYRIAYGDYFAYLADPANGFSTQTLPFDGGLELSVKTG